MANKPVKIVCTILGSRKNPFAVIKRSMKTVGMDAAREVIYDEGKYLASKIQLNILQQSLQSITDRPLSPRWARYKETHELDPRILIATGEYVNSIDARKKFDGSTVDVNVPDVTHESSGLNMRELGRIHEYGQRKFKEEGKGIPPRPHWRPTIRWWRKKRLEATHQEIDKLVAERVFKKLKSQIGTHKIDVKPRTK